MMIQQGVSVGGLDPSGSGSSHDAEGGGMTIGRVMDWIEARLDAIKSREEEEDEDEEREKERERGRPPASTGAKPDNKPAKPSVPGASTTRPKDQVLYLFDFTYTTPADVAGPNRPRRAYQHLGRRVLIQVLSSLLSHLPPRLLHQQQLSDQFINPHNGRPNPGQTSKET